VVSSSGGSSGSGSSCGGDLILAVAVVVDSE
jgi:hypothetical protein